MRRDRTPAARRLQGIQLPVNLTVADFYGGVVIGLFSFKIGDWLQSKLMSRENGGGRRASADAEETAKGASRGDGA